MLDSLKFYHKRIKEGVLKDMWRETVWIYEYARKYWKQMIFYTLLGLSGTVVSLISSLISRDMVDIITGKQAGLLVRTFCSVYRVFHREYADLTGDQLFFQ